MFLDEFEYLPSRVIAVIGDKILFIEDNTAEVFLSKHESIVEFYFLSSFLDRIDYFNKWVVFNR
jgi:hypothetical protein